MQSIHDVTDEYHGKVWKNMAHEYARKQFQIKICANDQGLLLDMKKL